MSENEINHQPCPFVSCASSDAFSYNLVKKTGHCKSCDRGYPSKEETYEWATKEYPVNSVVKSHEKIEGDHFKAHRGVNRDTMEFYGILTRDDTHRYPYPSGGVKVRNLENKKFFAEGLSPKEIFGIDKFTAGDGRRLTITEGELDAASAYQMLKSQGSSRYTNPVIGLPGATPHAKLWEHNRDWIDSFEEIILSVEDDDAGNALADKIARLFPGKVKRIDHGVYKDANEFLVNKEGPSFYASWWGARKYTPNNVMNSSDDFLEMYHNTPDHTFVPTGIAALDDKILGLMQGHFTVIKAETGIGKTEVMRLLEYNLLKQGVKIAAWHLEEVKLRSLLGLVSYELDDNVTRMDLIEQKGLTQEVQDAIVSLTEDENFYQFFLGDGDGIDQLCDQIRFFAEACDCRFVFFEPIQDVVVGSSDESKESLLADLSIRLSKLAAELDVGIITIAHTNDNGDPKYCKMIGQRASVMINLERDKGSDDMDVRNTTNLVVQKNRPCGDEGYAGQLRFNMDKFVLKEI